MALTDLLTVAVLAFVGSRLVGAARVGLSERGKQRWWAVVRGLRVRHFAVAIPVLLLVVVAVIAGRAICVRRATMCCVGRCACSRRFG